jgi:hypothetical protein
MRLLPPLPAVEGSAPPPPEMRHRLNSAALQRWALPHARDASGLLGASHLDADTVVQRNSSHSSTAILSVPPTGHASTAYQAAASRKVSAHEA